MTSTESESAERRATTQRLFQELRQAPADSIQARELRERLTELHLPLVAYLARRFGARSVPVDDLRQVGAIGLLKAIDRFDLDREIDFASYATPTILGEIRRHFRDSGWLLHVPRRAQELQSAIDRARGDLSHELSRSPTVPEIAERIGVSEERVLEALDVAQGYSGVSLDALLDPAEPTREAAVAYDDVGLRNAELRRFLGPALAALPEREQEILLLRFAAGRTQSEIARAVGISQMHVSRLIAKSLTELRTQLSDPESQMNHDSADA